MYVTIYVGVHNLYIPFSKKKVIPPDEFLNLNLYFYLLFYLFHLHGVLLVSGANYSKLSALMQVVSLNVTTP